MNASTDLGSTTEVRTRVWVKRAGQPLEPVHAASLGGMSSEDDAWIWCDIQHPTVEAVERVGVHVGLPLVAIEDSVDAKAFPKWEDHRRSLLVVLHFPSAADHKVATVPLVSIASERLLITSHHESNAALDWLLDTAGREPAVGEGGPDRMLARIAELSAREFQPLVDACESAFDRLEERALEAEPKVLADTMALRRDAGLLRSVLGTQREVVRDLVFHETPLFSQQSQRRLRDAHDRHHRLVEELDAARHVLSTVVDTYRGVVAERTNDVMKVLTVFAAILLPLSTMAGIYGMNFEHMPELGQRWGYPMVLGAMVLVAAGLWSYFVRRQFIGTPSLSRIPRQVGRGLHQVASAPVRTLGALATREGSGSVPRPAGGQSEYDRESLDVVADLFRLGWQTPRTILDAEGDR